MCLLFSSIVHMPVTFARLAKPATSLRDFLSGGYTAAYREQDATYEPANAEYLQMPPGRSKQLTSNNSNVENLPKMTTARLQ
jgi:hypothetical protein